MAESTRIEALLARLARTPARTAGAAHFRQWLAERIAQGRAINGRAVALIEKLLEVGK